MNVKILLKFTFLTLFILDPVYIQAERDTRPCSSCSIFVITPESTVFLNGSATLHDWDCKSRSVYGTVQVNRSHKELEELMNKIETSTKISLENETIASSWIEMPVHSFSCGNHLMEKDMHHALKKSTYPNIRFSLIKIKSLEVQDPVHFLLILIGTLEIAGVKKGIEIRTTIHRQEEHLYHVIAYKKMDMRDFKIAPPTALFGILRAHPQIQVSFDVYFKPRF